MIEIPVAGYNTGYFSTIPPWRLNGLWMDTSDAAGVRRHLHYRILKSGEWKVYEPKRCRIHRLHNGWAEM